MSILCNFTPIISYEPWGKPRTRVPQRAKGNLQGDIKPALTSA